jgi:hypothetical protein
MMKALSLDVQPTPSEEEKKHSSVTTTVLMLDRPVKITHCGCVDPRILLPKWYTNFEMREDKLCCLFTVPEVKCIQARLRKELNQQCDCKKNTQSVQRNKRKSDTQAPSPNKKMKPTPGHKTIIKKICNALNYHLGKLNTGLQLVPRGGDVTKLVKNEEELNFEQGLHDKSRQQVDELIAIYVAKSNFPKCLHLFYK